MLGEPDWIALASAIIASLAMAVATWQAVISRQQSKFAEGSARAAERAAAAAEKQAALTERQAMAAEQQIALAEEQAGRDASRLAKLRLKNDDDAINAVLPPLRTALAATPYIIYADTEFSPRLFELVQTVLDTSNHALAIAQDEALVQKLELLRQHGKAVASAMEPRWVRGFRVVVSTQQGGERRRQVSSLREFERTARAFLAEFG